ncbi:MAG: hypothetical protein COA88_14540 [Kordia sp.]|nr:MAG: hypothetical protein COA88_14540 [Kordia sp.]
MTTAERTNDILQGADGSLSSDELIHERDNVFKSIEYHCIFHYTNAELYYLDEESTQAMESADEVIETDKGTAYAFN